MLNVARKHFTAGGPLRIPYTLPPLIFNALKLAKEFKKVSVMFIINKTYIKSFDILGTEY